MFVLRDAAVPYSRLVASTWRAGRRRRRDRPAPVHAQRFWPQAREHGATWLSAGPTLHQMILDRVGDGVRPARCGSSGRVVPRWRPRSWNGAEQTYQAADARGLRMTEASHQMTSNPLPPAAGSRPRSGCRPAPRFASWTRGHAAAGRQRRRGRDPRARVMSGYVNNPAATAEAFFGDGSAPATAAYCVTGTSTRRTDQGDDHPRWREHRPGGDRAGACLASGGPRCRLLWACRRQVRRARRSGG